MQSPRKKVDHVNVVGILLNSPNQHFLFASLKVRHLHQLGFTNDQLIEAPWIFSEDLSEIELSMKAWNAEHPHPLLFLPADVNPILLTRGKKSRVVLMNQTRMKKEKLTFSKVLGSHRPNAALMEHELGLPIADVYAKARNYHSLIVKGYRLVSKVRLAKCLGLDSRFILGNYESFVNCPKEKLSERVKLLLDLVPHISEVDLLDSKAIFQNDLVFDLFYVSSGYARRQFSSF